MATEDLDRSDTRRSWTRPTLRRLSSGGQAGGAPTTYFKTETSFLSSGVFYRLGPISP